MSQRSSAFLFPIFALVAAAGMTGPVRAADECVAKPNTSAPQGEHWYYRRDPTTKRQCWFLAPQTTRLQKSSTNGANLHPARTPALPVPQPVAPSVTEASASAAPAAPAAEADVPQSALLARWPEPPAPSSFAPTPITPVTDLPPASVPNALTSPASGRLPHQPQTFAESRSLERDDAPTNIQAAADEARHVFALIMTALALLAIAGPVARLGGWPRRREAGGRNDITRLHHSSSSAQRWQTGESLDCRTVSTTPHRAPPPRPEMSDWSQQFAKAWQQLSDEAPTSRTRSVSMQRA